MKNIMEKLILLLILVILLLTACVRREVVYQDRLVFVYPRKVEIPHLKKLEPIADDKNALEIILKNLNSAIYNQAILMRTLKYYEKEIERIKEMEAKHGKRK